MNLEYWFMFPVAVAVATAAMASGVGGAKIILGMGLLAVALSFLRSPATTEVARTVRPNRTADTGRGRFLAQCR